jgi:DnaK suppressor protein
VAKPDHEILAEIERAFARMQDGSYGVSEVSGEPLGFDRLEALPWATRSAQEQQARERR